jgi:formylglycine-generating enzyme required for sulfatase activity
LTENHTLGLGKSRSIRGVVPGLFIAFTTLAVGMGGCTPSPARFPTAIPTAGLGSTTVSLSDGMSMVFVPSGAFEMGSKIGLADEQPVHAVTLDSFWIDRTEVTNAMYRLCVQAGACLPPGVTTYFNDPVYSDHPVVHVSWVRAGMYCTWAGRRLPTEAEWEKAAAWDPIKNEKRIYPWGNTFDCKKGNYEGSECDGFAQTAPVGSFPNGVSPYGALDMGGNVWEWVQDAFLETDPYLGGTKNYYAISPASNPKGVDPSITIYRLMRGGGWRINFGFGRSAYRLWFGLDDPYDFAGFRCAQSTSP